MIQVFEYFISHHFTKSFESIFGNVTCLPGCFSMFRIYLPKKNMVPILSNPMLYERYSVNETETLHQKNLLQLGEDRYLTTLLLQLFPTRKIIFIPSSIAYTSVPTTFKGLLTQRRRWINSTIHNLYELLKIPTCGVFCFSLNFVIFTDLIGSLVLPAALSFTLAVIISSIFQELKIVELILLGCILGLPGILSVLTTLRWEMIPWMIIYLISILIIINGITNKL
jgi:chitin synthase